MNLVIPEGMRNVLGVAAGYPGRMCINNGGNCNLPYRTRIRAMVTKLPGYSFSAY
jgi:hypothetical protein